MSREYFVYNLANKFNRVLYTGVTNDLDRRILEHKRKTNPGFTTRYNVDRLVFFEEFPDVEAAILREKQIKGGSRQDKIDLINSINPEWKDLAIEVGYYKPLFENCSAE